ncbi:DUF389 domain-containing protein [Abyssalbus ytuae]|uniref:DUF389 domain-containing protein n=1 Tax=Abyssalbus ytuae TaxID=2926907 RepID=A0A9E7D2T9_9FLAO|nr:DUF389 domain-containing protein [Abyssalbus ytuae]UOB18518.1 DUF389 domain-containing protein [Abyssalbus ytuae]
MEENIEKENVTPNSEETPEKDFEGVWGSLKAFFSELLDIRKNTDRETTIHDIKQDIPFKGHTSWILVCSIFIASIGLNANSTAVVIGAMLISPLMGPILGMGMSLAINDVDTLRRSIKNFCVMVGLSILTAFLFFRFFPLRDESSELLARTAPDIRDVLIAFFGGLALVIARAKKGTVASVIFGVAIATALMPPLCTVGFGLAISNFKYAAGAMYLFTINTIFIGLATFLVLKLLRFPMVKYANSRKRRFIGRVASVLAIAVMIPAGYTFYKVWQESRFNNQARQFINDNVKPYEFTRDGRYLDNLSEIRYNDGKEPVIELVFMGEELVPDNVIGTWKAQAKSFSALSNTDIKVIQGGKDDSEEKFKYVSELYESKKKELITREERIRILEEEVARLNKIASTQIPFDEITEEMHINYEGLAEISFTNELKTNFTRVDTIPVFSVKWEDSVLPADKTKEFVKMNEWLKLKLKNPKIQIKQLN